ncbi:hypothetical protein A1F94_009181 [Pyrenophora tritici-repentis]|nr:hypothetical protein A1F94_009181 [Pyrenophora tritici-repentis]
MGAELETRIKETAVKQHPELVMQRDLHFIQETFGPML